MTNSEEALQNVTSYWIKLYFQLGEFDEVRKIQMTHPGAASELSFQSLLGKIREIHPVESDQDLHIQYTDQDGDKVTVASSCDLQNALLDQVQQPYKFFVKSKFKANNNNRKSFESSVNNELHLCTSCHENIRGFRYKCLSCLNYELCQK